MFRSPTLKNAIVVIGALSLVLLTACSGTAPSLSSTPATGVSPSAGLVAQQPSLDLGRVPFNVSAEGRFDLTNTGTSEVRLLGPPQVKMLEGC